jgi:hypothetical protein
LPKKLDQVDVLVLEEVRFSLFRKEAIDCWNNLLGNQAFMSGGATYVLSRNVHSHIA